ncbi:MAG: tetratricopeptide repeat protein [Candidatus Omnitrophica bacterium]|nr:tetratricopeptide repeat protein [Candidatus Omnitrophota bacterium]
MSAPFKMLDDQASITGNRDVQSLQYVPKIFMKSFFGEDHFYYRPLVSVTYALEYRFFGLNYFFFNLVNILFHLATALVVFRWISLLLKSTNIGFWAAFLFAIHPVQVEAVGNIAGRSILLCAFFELSALLFFTLFAQKEKIIYFVLSLSSFVLALLAKESAACFPLIVFAHVMILSRAEKGRFSKAIKLSLPFFIVLGSYLVLRFTLKISNVAFVIDIKDYFCGILTFMRSLGTYARILVFPVDLHFDRITPVIYNVLSPDALITFAAAMGMMILLVKFFRRIRSEVLFLIAFIFLRFLPLSQIIPIRSQAGYICIPDHFLYVPSVGFLTLMILLFGFCVKVGVEKKYVTRFFMNTLAVGWIIFLVLTTIEQNIYATNEVAMYRRSLSLTPTHVRMDIALGLSYALDKNFEGAETYFQKALDYEPANTRARLGLGTALLDQNRCWDGLAEYDKITDAANFKDLMEGNKNLAYRKLIMRYEAMLKNDPANARIYYSLGVVYAKKGEFEKAIEYFKDTLKREPGFENAQANLCNSYKALGRDSEAKECFLNLEKKEKRIK